MSKQAQGLRFDIYERVNLSEETGSVEQLEELELSPHIQVISQGEQAVLKGHLLLSGQYGAGEENRDIKKLEHRIPVEITLPMNRIPDMNNMGVEIESFDIDMHSSRSLNVTGVLLLSGIEMSEQNESQSKLPEEKVFVHRQLTSTASDVHQQETTKAEHTEIARAEEVEEMQEQQEQQEQLNQQEQQVVQDEEMETGDGEGASEDTSSQIPTPQPPQAEENEEMPEDVAKLDEASVTSHTKEETAQEQQQLKVAFGSLPTSDEKNEDADVQSLLKRSATVHNEENKAQEHGELSTDAEEVEKVEAESAQWKSLFLTREDNEEAFSSMRMCIVQKEETMEQIADRYKLHPNELALHNRLQDQNLQEGQIIYIPK